MQQIIILLYSVIISIYGDKPDSGFTLIASGKFEKACKYISIAYEKNPLHPLTQFAYARTMKNGEKAYSIYMKVVENSSADDSLKAEASYQIGCYFLCENISDSAYKMFSNAEKLYHSARYKNMMNITEPEKNDIYFTLQTGAFSQRKNAERMLENLKIYFDTVNIIREWTNGKNLYKVLAGRFNNKNNALAFGEKHLSVKNIDFRVIKRYRQ